MARTKKQDAADVVGFADPENPTLHELNQFTQSLREKPAAAADEAPDTTTAE